MGNLQVGTIIKFKDWKDDLIVGKIDGFEENEIYKVFVNNHVGQINVHSDEIIEVVNTEIFQPIYKEPIKVVKRKVFVRKQPVKKTPAFKGIFADGGFIKVIDGLPNELTVYIPMFDSKGNPSTDEEIENRVSDAKSFLIRHFGEYIVEQKGSSYIDYEGNLTMRKHIQLSTYPTDVEFQSNKNILINQLSLWATDWSQDAMVVEYEEDMFYILPMQDMMKSGGELWIQDAVKQMEKKGKVGAFTKQAKREGLTPIEFAKKVSKNPKGYTLRTRRRAMFVKNANPELF
jgi:hypothetical protein